MSLDFIQIFYSKIVTFEHSDRTLTLNVFEFVSVQIVINKFRGSTIGLFDGFFTFLGNEILAHINIHDLIFGSENHLIFNEERISFFYLDTNGDEQQLRWCDPRE